MANTKSTIVAVAAEDGRYDYVWRRGLELARDRGARLVLFDVDAKPSPLESPLPTGWSAHGEEEEYGKSERVGEPLNEADLEAVGRGPIAERIREARRAGIEALGWLPDGATPEALSSFARHESASLVVVPAGSEFDEKLDLPVEAVPEPGEDEPGRES